MENEFKVMPWLRTVRDRSSAASQGLTPEEILRQTEQAASAFHREYMNSHPDTVVRKAGTDSGLKAVM